MPDLGAVRPEPASGALVRGVTHAVLNELAVVRLLLDTCRGTADDEALSMAGSIVSDVAELLGELGSLARGSDGVVRVDLGACVTGIRRLLDVAAGPSASVSVALSVAPVLATVDLRALQEALVERVASIGRCAARPEQVIHVAVAPGPVVSVDGRPVLVGEPLEESA